MKQAIITLAGVSGGILMIAALTACIPDNGADAIRANAELTRAANEPAIAMIDVVQMTIALVFVLAIGVIGVGAYFLFASMRFQRDCVKEMIMTGGYGYGNLQQIQGRYQPQQQPKIGYQVQETQGCSCEYRSIQDDRYCIIPDSGGY